MNQQPQNNQQYVPNGRINYVNPNFIPTQQRQQQQQAPVEAFNNYLQNGRPQITNIQPNNIAPAHQQQGPSTGGKRRSRRRDVLDMNQHLGVKERGDPKGNKKRKNTALDSGKNSKNNAIANKRTKRMDRALNEDNYDHLAQDMAEMTGRLNNLSKKSCAPKEVDLFLGDLSGVLDDEVQVAAFKKSLFRICPGNSIIITAQSYELPKETIGEDRKIRHIFIKYCIGWFDALKRQLYFEKNPNLNDPNDAANMDDEQILEMDRQVTTVDMFDKISEITELQYQNVLKHYKPNGLIYTIIDAGSITDSIIAAHCNIKKYPIIQLRYEGQRDFAEIKDKRKRAEVFGTLIGNVARYNNRYRRDAVEEKKIIPGKIFDMGKL